MAEQKHRAARRPGRPHSWAVVAAGAVLVAAGALGQAGSKGAPDVAVTTGPTTGWAAIWAPPSAPKSPSGTPRAVRIPALGVSARVVPIHAVHRTLVPPSDPRVLGWWADGAAPGAAEGSAVVTGHTVHTGGGAFDDLEDLHPGDRVVVRLDDAVLHYEVLQVAVFDKGALAQHADEAFSQHLPGRLVLVTCEDWDGERYLSNVVVDATLRT